MMETMVIEKIECCVRERIKRRMLRDVLQVIFRRTEDGRRRTYVDGRTEDGRRQRDGRDGTDGRTEDRGDDDDDGTRRDGRRGIPILSEKYIDGSPLGIDTHRYFRTSKKISEPVRNLKNKYFHLCYICYIYINIVIYMFEIWFAIYFENI